MTPFLASFSSISARFADYVKVSFPSSGDSEPAPDPAQTTPADPPFGLAGLIELFEDDRDAVVTLLEAASASIRSDVNAIADAMTSNDRRVAGEALHRLKGTSGSIGATHVLEEARRVEVATQHAIRLDTGSLSSLRAAVEDVNTSIRSFVGRVA